MADELTVGELLYCLIQDIEDYTMHVQDEDLDTIIAALHKIKSNYDKNKLTDKDLNLLTIMKIHFLNKLNAVIVSDTLNFKQFTQDLNTIIERVR